MTDKPKILPNDLDPISKNGEGDEKKINNPEVHDQIADTFDIDEIKESLLNKPNMKSYHREWMQKKIDEMLKDKNIKGLKKLDQLISFSERGGLVVNTAKGQIKFMSKEDVYDYINNINITPQNILKYGKNDVYLNMRGLNEIKFYNEKNFQNKKMIPTKDQLDLIRDLFPTDSYLLDIRGVEFEDFMRLLGISKGEIEKRSIGYFDDLFFGDMNEYRYYLCGWTFGVGDLIPEGRDTNVFAHVWFIEE